MQQSVYILLPSAVPSGPVKGGIALANLLSQKYTVKLVFVGAGSFFTQGLSDKVEIVYLSRKLRNNFLAIFQYGNLLISNRNTCNYPVFSISMCFSCDFINAFMRFFSHTISSVRGNLIVNYTHTYPRIGFFLAHLHFFVLRFLRDVYVMSDEMYKQVSPYVSRPPILINNFIDEPYLDRFRIRHIDKSNSPSIIFVGSLTSRKSPELLLKTFLNLELHDTLLHFVGDGPLLHFLKRIAIDHQFGRNVIFHGHLDNPYHLIASSDVFVLPSLSEGISRACLEALYLGVPCILTDVDANSTIITNNNQGALFSDVTELSRLIPKYLKFSRSRISRSSLLSAQFTRAHALSLLTNHLSTF